MVERTRKPRDVQPHTVAGQRLRLTQADAVIHCLELGGRWTAEMMEWRDDAINRHRARQRKGPLPAAKTRDSDA